MAHKPYIDNLCHVRVALLVLLTLHCRFKIWNYQLIINQLELCIS